MLHVLRPFNERIQLAEFRAGQRLPPHCRWGIWRKSMQERLNFCDRKASLLCQLDDPEHLDRALIIPAATIDPLWLGQQTDAFVVAQGRRTDTSSTCDFTNCKFSH